MAGSGGGIKDKAFDFAVRIVKLYKYLSESKREFILSKQVLRSGTSVGANVEEAHGGISTPDFSNKISIAYKEAKETQYWLKLLNKTDYINTKLYNSISADCEELCKILFTIIKKTRIDKKDKT